MSPSSSPRVTVGIPIGPGFREDWLVQAVKSAQAQTVPVEVLVVDDMATPYTKIPMGEAWRHGWGVWQDYQSGWIGSYSDVFPPELYGDEGSGVHWWRSPWNLGVGQAFNHCVALAFTDLVFMMGHDDYLAPDCIERCLAVFDRAPDQWAAQHAYYYVPLQYIDTGEIQAVPCNAAMVHKQLWRDTGGFPPETGSGAPDAAFISRAMVAPETGFPCILQPVESDHALYFYRRHPATDTAKRGPWQGVILETRDILTRHWEPPTWGRS